MDNRGRVAIPAKLVPLMRAASGAKEEETFDVVVSVSMEGRVGIYPLPHYEKILANLNASPEEDPVGAELRRNYLNYMEVQNTDKQNRVRIPQLLAEKYKLKGEVVVMGSGEYLEVVNKNDWKLHLDARTAMFNENRGILGKYLAGKVVGENSKAGGDGGQPDGADGGR